MPSETNPPAPIHVILAEWDPDWPRLAMHYAGQLTVLGTVLIETHHIGSTAIAGLAAKPVIDLMPVVSGLATLDQCRFHLEKLGYQWHGELGISGRRYCTLAGA